MPQGRIVLKSICQSKKLSELHSDGARLLYTWLIPCLDIKGRFSGDEEVIKGQIFTRLGKTTEEITEYLNDLAHAGLIIWYDADNDKYLQVPDFADRQPSLNASKEAKSSIPDPTPDQIQRSSCPTPPKAKESEAKGSKGKQSLSEGETGSSFPSGNGSSVVSQEQKFSMRSVDLFGCAKNGDKTTLKNIAKHLAGKFEYDDKVFDKAWRIAQECRKTGDKPIALFISRMKDEYGYRKTV